MVDSITQRNHWTQIEQTPDRAQLLQYNDDDLSIDPFLQSTQPMNNNSIQRDNRTVTTGYTGAKRCTEAESQPAAKHAKTVAEPAPQTPAQEDHLARAVYLIHQVMVQRQLPYHQAIEAVHMSLQHHAATPSPVSLRPAPNAVRLQAAPQRQVANAKPLLLHLPAPKTHTITVATQGHAPISKTVGLCVSTSRPKATPQTVRPQMATPQQAAQASRPQQTAPAQRAAQTVPPPQADLAFEQSAWWNEPNALPNGPASPGTSGK